MIYRITCDRLTAEIEILPEALPIITELVKFYVDWESRLAEADCDFAQLWCEDIAPELEWAASVVGDHNPVAVVDRLRAQEACWPDEANSQGIRLASIEYIEPDFTVEKLTPTEEGK